MPKTKSNSLIFTGTRKLFNKKSHKEEDEEDNNTTEDMLDILNSDSKSQKEYKGIKKEKEQPKQPNVDMSNVDPYLINDLVPTNTNGEITNFNSIGNLLGLANNNSLIPPISLDSTVQNPNMMNMNQQSQQLLNALPNNPMTGMNMPVQFNGVSGVDANTMEYNVTPVNPTMSATMPQMSATMPQMSATMPQMSATMPQMNVMPQMSATMPQMNVMPQTGGFNSNILSSIKNLALLSNNTRLV